jgi:hypothetical protein
MMSCSTGRPSVSVPVLSTTERRDRCQRLDRLGIAEQHAELRASSRCNHDRDRRRKSERARAGDDEHCDRVDERMGKSRLRSQGHPEHERDRRNRHHGRNKPLRDSVRELLQRRAAPLRLGDQLHDVGEQRIGADFLGLDDQRSALVDRGTDHAVASALLNRKRLPRQHRFVDRARSFQYAAIHRHFLAWAHAQVIALRALDRSVRLPLRHRSDAAGVLRRKAE